MKRSWLCQTGRTWEPRAVRTQSKHTQSEQTSSAPSLDTILNTYVNTTHTLAHKVLATWYPNLPPGRELKICHSYYLLRSHEQRWLTARWIAPLCSMMQCNAGGAGGWPTVIYLLCCGMCIGGVRGVGALKSQCLVTFRSGLESRAQPCGISLPTAGLQCQE